MFSPNQRDSIEGKSDVAKIAHESECDQETVFENDLKKLNGH